MEYKCLECLHVYDSADDALRCRINGLLCTPAGAADCKRFVPDIRSDDDGTVPEDCDWLGRGD
jgi:hypothetical protein